jgi:hypothetical protein
MMLAIFSIGILLLLFTVPAQATVYGWRGVGGELHLSNDPEAVPEVQRPSARQFTSKLVGVVPPASPVSEPSSTTETAPVNLQLDAYQRGLEHGLQTAERQVALAGELAQKVLAAVPRTPPPRIIVQQPGPVIIRDVSPVYYPSFPGFGGPYDYHGLSAWSACGSSSRFSFTPRFRCSRFVRHSHFFPGSRRSRAGVFFPHGHSSHHGFLFGHGFVAR